MKISGLLYRLRFLVFVLFKEKTISVKTTGRIGKNVSITASNIGKISIGKDVCIEDGVHIGAVEGGILTIGDNCFINRNCIVACRARINIGDDCIFGPGVAIYDHDHIYTYKGVTNNYKTGEILIGKGTWICANVTILRGTHIGKNCVIGAGTVVSGSIPDGSMVTNYRKLVIRPIK